MNLKLLDHSETVIGEIVITSENGIILGNFFPMISFFKYANLFKDFEQATNDQLLVEVDRLEKEIDSLGFYVLDTINGMKRKILDLQVMEAGISFYWKK